MASIPLIPGGSGLDLTTSFTDMYVVPSSRSRAGLDAIVFNNYSTSNVTISLRLVQAGAGDIFDEVVTDLIIKAGRNYLAPSIIGQALTAGGKLQAKVSANNSVNGQITVTEIEV